MHPPRARRWQFWKLDFAAHPNLEEQFQADFYTQFRLDNRVGMFLLTAGLLLVSGIYDTLNDNANGDRQKIVSRSASLKLSLLIDS